MFIQLDIKSDKNITFLGELISEKEIFILDVSFYGADISGLSYIKRYEIGKEIEQFNKMFKTKPQYLLKDTFPDIFETLLKLPNQDGIIFNKNLPLIKTEYYKWKPTEELSIDFIVKKVKDDEYNLFTMITRNLLPVYKFEISPLLTPDVNENYIPVLFTPFINKKAYIWKTNEKIPDGVVCEVIPILNGWKLKKIRDERVTGNDYKVAEKLYLQHLNPITIDFLKDPLSEPVYFQLEANQKTKQQRKFVSFVRGELIRQLQTNYKRILILAAGRGAELFIVNKIEADEIVHVDCDISALQELIHRLQVINKPTYYVDQKTPDQFAKNYVLHVDLLDDYKKIADKIFNQTGIKDFNAIVMNLAIHYITIDPLHLQNLVNLVNLLLTHKGIFMWTGFDGLPLFNKLSTTPDLKYYDGNELIYHIQKKYKETKLTYGCTIGVLMPFAMEYIDENLIDYSLVIKAFEQLGFQLRQYGSINNFIPYSKLKMGPTDVDYNSNIYYVSVFKP
jgi:Ni,Fe-hydrogenase maturation factor